MQNKLMPTLAKMKTFGTPPTLGKPPVFAGASAKTKEQHMKQQSKSGRSQRAIASDFATSKSTVNRKLKGYSND